MSDLKPTTEIPKADAAALDVQGGSPDRFGFEWGVYDDVKPAYEEQFRRWLPFFQPEDWVGRSFLDVGCGMGRNSFWPLTYGARRGMSIDVDPRSLASARQTLAAFPNVEICQLSAYEIEATAAFDIVFSIGVVHHLEWPDKALSRMVQATKPGGQVAIWVYGRENNGWLLWALDPLRRILFSKLPIRVVHLLSYPPTVVLWIVLRLGLSRSPYFRLLRGFSFTHLRSIVFDQFLPRISHYWRRDEVEALMAAAGLEQVELHWVNEMSWAARGTRPSSLASQSTRLT